MSKPTATIFRNLNKVERLPKIYDNWFKLKIVARRPKEGEEEIEYSYQSGHDKFIVLQNAKEALGPGYIVSIKKITYNQIIKELEVACDKAVHTH